MCHFVDLSPESEFFLVFSTTYGFGKEMCHRVRSKRKSVTKFAPRLLQFGMQNCSKTREITPSQPSDRGTRLLVERALIHERLMG
jgi:hypothetical protein